MRTIEIIEMTAAKVNNMNLEEAKQTKKEWSKVANKLDEAYWRNFEVEFQGKEPQTIEELKDRFYATLSEKYKEQMNKVYDTLNERLADLGDNDAVAELKSEEGSLF